jgi:hypothetical protein
VVNSFDGYVLATPWSPPAAWKNNNSILGNNSNAFLRPSNYQDYADYLAEFCRIMLNNGAPIYVVSIQNEPTYDANYDGARWSAEQNRDFFLRVGRFTQGVAGYGGGKWLDHVMIMDGESHNEVNAFHEPAMLNQQSRRAIDIVGRHSYGATNSAAQAYYPRAQDPVSTIGSGIWVPSPPTWVNDSYAREVWQTEKNINSENDIARLNDSTWNWLWIFMNDIDFTIRHCRENAYIWWSLKRFYSMLGDGTLGTVNSAVLPRGHGLSHYAKYSKETGRVGFTVSGTLADGETQIVTGNNGETGIPNANVNPSVGTSGAQGLGVKITAHVTLRDGLDASNWNFGRNNLGVDDISAISLVMYTPTNNSPAGDGGHDMGTIKIQLPAGFVIRNAEAMRSTREEQSVMEPVTIGQDRNTAYVTLPRSNVLSVRFTK